MTADPIARAKLEIAVQQGFESSLAAESILQLDEVVYLNSKLSGAITSFAYLDSPSLASIGAAH